MKGIILAGGNGTRLFPTSQCISKQLLPVYDKPAIYYPLSTLMFMDIREIAIISTPRDLPLLQSLLGDGHSLGLEIHYFEQSQPRGIADAYNVAADFVKDSPSCLILGDNLFFGFELPRRLRSEAKNVNGATLFTMHVRSPEKFGVVEVDQNFSPLNLWEKPEKPKSNWAVTGLYLYDTSVLEHVKRLKPSPRGELEITDLNKLYLEEKKLKVVPLGRGTAWLDTGTPESLLKSAQFVQTIEDRQGVKISCIEEVAWRRGFIDRSQMEQLCVKMPRCAYRAYLEELLQHFESEPAV